MRDEIFQRIGSCLVTAQMIELQLCLISLLEERRREPSADDLAAFAARVGEARAYGGIARLADALRKKGIADAHLVGLVEVSKRRDHYAHRVVHDSHFLRALSGVAWREIEADRILLDECFARLARYYSARAGEIGITLSRTAASTLDEMCSFADLVLAKIREIRD